jgi:hypothetical protein
VDDLTGDAWQVSQEEANLLVSEAEIQAKEDYNAVAVSAHLV